MQVRLVAVLLLSGCYMPGVESSDREIVELSPHAVTREGSGSEHARSYDYRSERSELNERNVGESDANEPAAPEQPSLQVTDIPVTVIDCSKVGLTVVGPWQAAVGASLTLNVLVRGLESLGVAPELTWQSTAGEITELGPASAEVTCSVPGPNTVNVELEQPAPCPSQIELAINCQ